MYNIDFRNFVYSLLPPALRGSVAELCSVLATPFKTAHHRFIQYKEWYSWLLEYNCTAQSIEDMLNKYFDIPETIARRIRVTDGTAIASVTVYREADHFPVVLGSSTLHSHTTWGHVPFVVEVPAELYYSDFPSNQVPNESLIGSIDRLVNLTKLYGLKHNTIPYD